MPDISWDELDLPRFYGFSAVGLVGSRLLLYPPMLLKTRMQTQKDMRAGMRATARQVVAREGVRGLYRGAVAVAVGVLPTQSIYLTTLEVVRARAARSLHRLAAEGGAGAQHPELMAQLERMAAVWLAGGIASCASAGVGVPLDVVTQRMQMGGGSFSVVVNAVMKAEGARGFYRGYLASLVTYVPTSSVWWTTYSNMCVLLGKDDNSQYASSIWRSAVAGAMAGVTAAICTNPLDVLKTRYQTQNLDVSALSYSNVARLLLKEEGWRGLLRGTSARISSMAPTGTIMILSYETVKRLSRKQN